MGLVLGKENGGTPGGTSYDTASCFKKKGAVIFKRGGGTGELPVCWGVTAGEGGTRLEGARGTFANKRKGMRCRKGVLGGKRLN